MEESTTQTRAVERRAVARSFTEVAAEVKTLVIGANVVISLTLASIGLAGMLTAERGLGVEHPWSAFLWIMGLVSLFLIPVEICVLKSRKNLG